MRLLYLFLRMENKEMEFQSATRENWSLLEELFESRGGPHTCWCMVWRKFDSAFSRSSKTDKKLALQQYVNRQVPIGIIGIHGREPVAWCSVAPRESYRNLGGDRTLTHVWSLVCFFVKREFRNQRLTEKLIRESLALAKSNGAKYLEAYPVNADSPSYRFMGFKSTFEQLGFTFIQMAGKRRHAMIYEF